MLFAVISRAGAAWRATFYRYWEGRLWVAHRITGTAAEVQQEVELVLEPS